MKTERACFRALGMSILLVTILITAGVVQGAPVPLWNNGTVSLSAAPQTCDGPCGSTSGPLFTVFDNFTVTGANKWIVTGFDFSDFFVNTNTSQYTTGGSTLWSIWSGDPMNGGTVLKSGTAVASLGTPDCTNGVRDCLVKMTVTGISVTLGSGTYYLGTSNIETGGGMTERAIASGNGVATSGYEASNALDPNNPPTVGSTLPPGASLFGGDTAFDITGTITPEPGTLTFMGLALAGLCMYRRFHRKATM